MKKLVQAVDGGPPAVSSHPILAEEKEKSSKCSEGGHSRGWMCYTTTSQSLWVRSWISQCHTDLPNHDDDKNFTNQANGVYIVVTALGWSTRCLGSPSRGGGFWVSRPWVMKGAGNDLLFTGLLMGVYTGRRDGFESRSSKSSVQETLFSLYSLILLTTPPHFCCKDRKAHFCHSRLPE